MKKLILPAVLSVSLLPPLAAVSFADYQNMSDQIETVSSIWVGGYFSQSDSSVTPGGPEVHSLPESGGRVGSSNAMEYYSPDSSVSGGVFFDSAPVPHRVHLEFDYYNDNDWYGDLRYSFEDIFQIRVLPRRFYHNLEKLTLFDYDPTDAKVAEVANNDAGIDDYGMAIDIDQFRLRLKTPNYPFHIYGEGEIIKREGSRQLRYLGGSGYFYGGSDGGRVRVSDSSQVDQQTRTTTLGSSVHLGAIELDVSRKDRKFDSDVASPVYDYQYGFAGATAPSVHNVLPELKATTNTIKIHTAQTGRIFATATYSEVDKTNEYSGAKAGNTLSYGSLSWLPRTWLSISGKVRRQENDASAPASVDAYNREGELTSYEVHPGVSSTTDMASLAVRYTRERYTSLNGLVSRSVKEVDEESALDWERPPKTIRDIYQLGISNWAIPGVRLTGKYTKTNIDTDLDPMVEGDELEYPINNDPESTDRASLGVTWLISPKVSTYLSADLTKTDTGDNQPMEIAHEAETGESLQQQFLFSLAVMVNEKLSFTPTYTYISSKAERSLAWEDGAGAHYIDRAYTSEQTAQNFSLGVLFIPFSRLQLNASVDYTTTDGSYEPSPTLTLNTYEDNVATGTFDFNLAEVAQFSKTSTEELNLRLDSDLALARGWGIGLDLRYTDWVDKSFDNPSDGTFLGGLVKLTKVFGTI